MIGQKSIGILAGALLLGIAALVQAGEPIRPDPKLTPGATDPRVTQANIASTICRKGGYTASVRHTSAALKNKIYDEYGITSHKAGTYEIDHDISLEIGGADVDANLWPQSYVTKPLNAHVKDALEDRLHALVCAGKLKLSVAQEAIRSDWVKAYRDYVGPLPKD